MLRISKNIIIPDEEFEEEFFQSSGPGGQNVNKVATAVRLRFNVRTSAALPDDVRSRLLLQVAARLNAAGEIAIEAKRFRTQLKNRQDAAERMQKIIRGALVAPRKRRPTKPSRGSIQKRLDAKKKRGAIKKLRRESD